MLRRENAMAIWTFLQPLQPINRIAMDRRRSPESMRRQRRKAIAVHQTKLGTSITTQPAVGPLFCRIGTGSISMGNLLPLAKTIHKKTSHMKSKRHIHRRSAGSNVVPTSVRYTSRAQNTADPRILGIDHVDNCRADVFCETSRAKQPLPASQIKSPV